MANYENWLTVIGSKLQLWRFDRILRREMDCAMAQSQLPCRKTAEIPHSFHCYSDRPRFKGYGFCTGFLPVAYIRNLSRRFPALTFNLSFDIDIDGDVWDEGFEQSGDLTFINGETACGYFTFEAVNRYPAWDSDPDPSRRNLKIWEVS